MGEWEEWRLLGEVAGKNKWERENERGEATAQKLKKGGGNFPINPHGSSTDIYIFAPAVGRMRQTQ